MEASYGHLPITPFHGGLQKVKRKVDGFTRGVTIGFSYSLREEMSRRKLPSQIGHIVWPTLIIFLIIPFHREAWTDQVSRSNRFLASMASSMVRLINSATVGMSSMSPITCPIG